MLKLMKYEFRKQLFSKFCILGIIILAEINFLFRVMQESESGVSIAISILAMLTYGVLIFVAFESIIVYSRDLKTKQSYMLFLVPKSTYSIIGAKLIVAMLQIILVSVAFIVLAFVDYFIIGLKFGGFKETVEIIKGVMRMLNMQIDVTRLIISFSYLAILWFICIIMAMLSITLSTTLLANSKFKLILSIFIFVLLIFAIFKLFGIISPNMLREVKIIDYFFPYLYLLGVSGLGYFLTAWMLDEKVSV